MLHYAISLHCVIFHNQNWSCNCTQKIILQFIFCEREKSISHDIDISARMNEFKLNQSHIYDQQKVVFLE